MPLFHNTTFSQRAGFTLIELIVALGLFSVVSTISVGSLVVLLDNNRQLRNDQVVISNIGFALDMMSRDIRSGFDYYCVTYPPGVTGSGGGSANDDFQSQGDFDRNQNTCQDGFDSMVGHARHGVSFVEPESQLEGVTDISRTAYYFDRGQNTIMRRRGSEDPPESIISDSLRVVDADFVVTGERGTQNQPTVTIYLEVEAEDGQIYHLQTTVTQRLLDIN